MLTKEREEIEKALLKEVPGFIDLAEEMKIRVRIAYTVGYTDALDNVDNLMGTL